MFSAHLAKSWVVGAFNTLSPANLRHVAPFMPSDGLGTGLLPQRGHRRRAPRRSLLCPFSVRAHRSKIMFGVLVVVLRSDHIVGQGFSSG